MNDLYTDLKHLGHIFNIKLYGKKKTSSVSSTKSVEDNLGLGLHKKTRKNNIKNDKNTGVSFKRGPVKRRFKKPFFLSSK